MRYLLLILIFPLVCNGQQSDSLMFRIDTGKVSYTIFSESTSHKTELLDSTGEVAYKMKDSTWVILDSVAALRVALMSLGDYIETTERLYKKIRAHETFMAWLNRQACGNFLFNQFYKSYYPENHIEVPEYNKQ